MSAIHFRAPLAAAAFACLFVLVSHAQTPAKTPAKPAVKAPAAAGPWAKVPPLSTACFQYVAGNTPDPFYARLEAAKAAVAADRDRQLAINAKIAEEMNSIDPMEQAQRMQQWMMSNPQAAMEMMQANQTAVAQAPAAMETVARQHAAREASWKALVKSYEDARIAAYAPLEPRRKALEGSGYSAARKRLLNPYAAVWVGEDASMAELMEGERLTSGFDRAYKALCPQWWGANGKFHAYLKSERNWFIQERIPSLEKEDASRLQQYAMFSTPAATYRSTAAQQGVIEYLDLAYKVFNERDSSSRCERPRDCDGEYP